MISLFITMGRFLRSLWLGFKEREFRALFFFVVILILSGTAFYMQTEKWSLVDAVYFCVTTLTTVGSQLHPTTDASKIFTMVYIFLGLGSVGGFIAAIAHHAKEQHPDLDKIAGRLRRKQD
ncbi:MAG TPA: potassium channel family protein [Candidatus Saccharimonadia bacterium]|jgi:hypothetical protein|nr:potassium channel family protein [Candidatus Saccharimonadia bacterium]